MYKTYNDRFPQRQENTDADYMCFLLMHELLQEPPDFEKDSMISLRSATWLPEKFAALKQRPSAMQFLMAPDGKFHDEYEAKNEDEWDPEGETWLDMCEKGRLQGVWWWGVMNFYVQNVSNERKADGFGDNVGVFVEELVKSSLWPIADVLCAFMPVNRRSMDVPVQRIFDETRRGEGIRWLEELNKAS